MENLHLKTGSSILSFKSMDRDAEVDVRITNARAQNLTVFINEQQAYDIIDFLLKQYPSLKDNLT